MARGKQPRHLFTNKAMKEEDYEDTHRVPEIRDPERQRDIGHYLIREQVKQDIQQHIDEGMSFYDAAEKAGIPGDLAFSRTFFDPDFRGMYDEAKGREVKDKRFKRFEGLDLLSPIQVKQEFVSKLYAAGLFDKIAALAAIADPTTKDGQNLLGFFMRHVIKDVLPREMTSMVEHKTSNNENATIEELKKRLADARRSNKKLEEEKFDAESKRIPNPRRAGTKGPAVGGAGEGGGVSEVPRDGRAGEDRVGSEAMAVHHGDDPGVREEAEEHPRDHDLGAEPGGEEHEPLR